MKGSNPRIAVVGGYGIGMTIHTGVMPGAGETVIGHGFSAGPGGKGSNQAIGARRLGADVHLFTAVGIDSYGEQAQALWVNDGVGCSKVMRLDQAPTMAAFIIVEPSGENRIIISPGALECPTDQDIGRFSEELEASDVCLVSLEISMEAAVAALERAHLAGTTTILNPGPAAPLPESVWSSVDYVVASETEAAVLTGVKSSQTGKLLDNLRKRTDAVVVLTRGERGAIVDEHGNRQEYPAPAVQVVDTTGADDAFAASLAVEIARGTSLAQAVTAANYAAAYSIQRSGAIPSLPSEREVREWRLELEQKGRGKQGS